MKKKLFTLLTLLLAVCSVAWADPVTIGYTNTTTTTSKEATTETVTGSGTDITVSKIAGTSSTISEYTTGDKAMQNGNSTDVYSTHAYKWNTNIGTTIDDNYMNTSHPNEYVGFSFTVASGKKFSISGINAKLASSANHVFKIRIEDNMGNVLYTGASKTINRTSDNEQTISSLTSDNAAYIQDLTAGTYNVKAFLSFNSTGKYFVFTKLQVTGTVGEDDTPTYTITTSVADGQSDYGTASPSSTTVLQGGSTIITATANEGYDFVNWTVNGTSVSTDRSYTVSNVLANAAYVANFKSVIRVAYQSTYRGTYGKALTSYSAANGINEKWADRDNKYTIPSYADKCFYREGYRFNKWQISGDVSSNRYNSGDEITVTDGTISNNIVTLNPSFVATTKTLSDATAKTVVTWSFDKADMVFVDWQSSNYGYYTQTATVAGEKIAVPMKIANGKVSNYTRAAEKNAQVNIGTTFTIPAVNGMKIAITDASTEFSTTTIAGSTSYEGTGTKNISYTYTGNDATIDIVINESKQYLKNIVVTYPSPYGVTYDGNGGTGSVIDNDTYDLNTEVSAKANGFTKAGYVFNGWNTKADGSGTAVAAGGTFSFTGNTTLYAQWIAGAEASITYTLNVNNSNTNIFASSSTTDNTNISSITVDQTNAAGTGDGASDRTTKLPIKTGTNGETLDNPTNYVLFKFTVADGKVFVPTDIAIKVANVGNASANNIKYQATLTDAASHSISGTYIVTTQEGEVETFNVNNSGKVGFTGEVTLKLWAWTIADKTNGGSAFRMGTPLTINGYFISSVNAKIGSNQIATFCNSTYDLDFTNVEGLTAWKAASCDGSSVRLEQVTGKVKASCGLIIEGVAGNYPIPVTTGGVDIYSETKSEINMFHYSPIQKADDGTNYVLTVQNDKVVFAPVGNTPATLSSDKAALWTSLTIDTSEEGGEGARTLSISFGDEATAIDSVIREVKADGSVYSLSGQRVAKPTKGLYIVNGKKVIIK